MFRFLDRHREQQCGQLSGFDRVRFRGTFRRICTCGGLVSWLRRLEVRFSAFKDFSQTLTRQVIGAATAVAEAAGRPVRYLGSSNTSKEEVARRIAEEDGVQEGLVCMLACVEPCWSYVIRRDFRKGLPEFRAERRQCKHIYHYFIHPEVGWMYVRLQSWLPFTMWIGLNGREWLSRQMDREGLTYRRRENCFTSLEDPARAQALMDLQLTTNWPGLLNSMADSVNPIREQLFGDWPLQYYWSAEETEWATDVMFESDAALNRLYPHLLHHAMIAFHSHDVMRFLGRKVHEAVPTQFQGEVIGDLRRRPEGTRVKHAMNANWIKMYDKQGSVLRVETTINNTRDFRVFRSPEGKPKEPPSWRPLRKGTADMKRRAEVSQRANERYLDALSVVGTPQTLGELLTPICRRTTYHGRPARGLNPTAPHDLRLLQAVSSGEFLINGFRNRDIRHAIYGVDPKDAGERRRQSAAVGRQLRLLRAHGLIAKVPKTHRYITSARGQQVIAALLQAEAADVSKLAAAA